MLIHTVRISVIIPAYKAASTLPKAVHSVIAQTERNIEIIIIDDKSPDNTWEIAQELASKDARIRLIRLPENRGKSYAVNHATSQAKGDWVAILDADDWYAPTRLEQLVNAAEAHGVDMVADNIMEYDSNANAYAGTTFPKRDKSRLLTLDDFLARADTTTGNDYGLLKPIFNARFIRDHNIAYDEKARISEDFYILLCFFMAGGKALLCADALYYYTQPFGTLSRQWAQEGRKRYRYEDMQMTHEHYVNLFRSKLSPSQLYKLEKRGKGITTLITFYHIRECIAQKNFLAALKRLCTAPLRFWLFLAKRIYGRLKHPSAMG